MGEKIESTASFSMQASMTATARVKAGMAQRHLTAAKYFSEQCLSIESEAKEEWPQPQWSELMSYSLSATIMSAAALEASINELFLQAIDKNTNALESISKEQMALLGELWLNAEKFPILEKYQIVLTACGKEPMKRGEDPFQSASSLVALRNMLVHFKPEWDDELDKHSSLESRLSGKFPLNKLAGYADGQMVWFPNHCMGAGCAQWAVTTTQFFSKKFCSILGIRERLN